MSLQGLASPWGSGALDLPSTPTSPSMHASRHPLALQTPPGTTRSPSTSRTLQNQAAEDMLNMPSASCLLSEYSPFTGSPGAVANGGPSGGRAGGASPPAGLGSSPKRPTGYTAKGLASRNASLAAAQSRRRTSSNSDQSDSGRL